MLPVPGLLMLPLTIVTIFAPTCEEEGEANPTGHLMCVEVLQGITLSGGGRGDSSTGPEEDGDREPTRHNKRSSSSSSSSSSGGCKSLEESLYLSSSQGHIP
jgi:hypothetical protein